jgi:hypothetical protein
MFLQITIYNFLTLGWVGCFFGSTMPFTRQDYKLQSLINPIFKKKNFELVDFFYDTLQIVFFWGCDLFLHLIIISYIVIPWQVEPMFVK